MPSQRKKKNEVTKEHHNAPTQRKTRSTKATEVPAEAPPPEAQQTGKGELLALA